MPVRKATKVEDNRGVEFDVTYEGAVIQTFERNGYHDSDFYAVVYDAESDSLKTVEYATTRGWTYANSATVDVTEENLEKARLAAEAKALKILTFDAQLKAETVEVGKVVRFEFDFNGRTQPKAKAGEEAQVSHIFEDNFRHQWGGGPALKAKVTTADGREFVLPVEKFEVVNPEQYYDQAALAESAARWAKTSAESKNFRGILEGWIGSLGRL